MRRRCPIPANESCPGQADIGRVLAGHASRVEQDEVLRHLDTCAGCAEAAGMLAERDTFVTWIRQANALGDAAPEVVVARVVARLSQLKPEVLMNSEDPGVAEAAGAGRERPALPSNVPTIANVITPPRPEDTAAQAPSGEPDDLTGMLAPAEAPDEIGRLGSYRVLRVLGAGGMGVVYRAEDPVLQRPVAIKAMRPIVATMAGAKQRFLREARAAAAIKHDHIVTIHHVGEDRGVPFLAMELLEGEPLDQLLNRAGKLPVTEAVRIARQTAEGLAAAHRRDLIHRDIKPANLWIEAETGRVKILDFGLARATDDRQHITQQGVIVGTPAFMAPEQAQGKAIDARCDLFSLGCVLYRMLTGKAPFEGKDVVSTILAVATTEPAPPRALNADVPPALSGLVLRLLAKKAENRPAAARDVAEALAAIERAPESAPGGSPAVSARRRRIWPIAAALGLFAVGAALGAYQIIIRLTDEKGNVREIPVAPGEKIEIVQGKQPGDPNKSVPLAEPTGPPFVRLRKDREIARYATLAEAIPACNAGEIIEIRGNGPIAIGEATDIRIRSDHVIRAAPGFRPLLTGGAGAKTGAIFFCEQGSLRLEGIDFSLAGDTRLMSLYNTTAEIVGCRITLVGEATNNVVVLNKAARLRLRESAVLSASNLTPIALVGVSTESLEIANSVVACKSPYTAVADVETLGHQVVYSNSTLLGSGAYFRLNPDGPAAEVEVRRCLFAGRAYCFSNLAAQQLCRWKGAENVYGLDPVLHVGDKTGVRFAEWVKRPDKPEVDSELAKLPLKSASDFVDPSFAVMFRKLATHLAALRKEFPDRGADPPVAEGRPFRAAIVTSK